MTNSSRDEPAARAALRANEADRHVRARIVERRVALGMTRQQFANLIGVSYQQAHKYEVGLNRISAGRLYNITLVLNVSISWLYEGLGTPSGTVETPARQRLSLELMRSVAAIDNDQQIEALNKMARSLAAQSTPRKGRSE